MDKMDVAEANLQDGQSGVQELPHTDSDNKFQRAIASWRNIDLTTLLSQLDATASEIVSNSKDALLERKDVAQRTKEFRKLDDAGKLLEYKTLLKAYQSFVDLLTTHNKTSSAGFLQLYTPLSEAPDPFPLLEASIESVVTAEETVPRLSAENNELQKRVAKLTTQLDETEHKLQHETSARQEAESGSGTRIKDIEESWSRVLEEKQSNWTAKEKVLEEKVENQERLLQELKASYEVAQRLGHGSDEVSATMSKAASAELELMSSDLEKTSARLAEMEARNEQLRLDLAKITSQKSVSSEDEVDRARLQTENSALLRKLETLRFEKDADRKEWDSKIRQAERQRTSVSKENQDLKGKLHRCSDYDELKRELSVLRTIEFSVDGEDDADDDGETNQARMSSGSSKKESLEQLLLARNKKLSNDLTLLRVSHQKLEEQMGRLREEASKTNAELEKSQQLSTTLENDLMRVQEEAATALPSSAMSVAGTYTSRYPGSLRRGRASPTSSIISGFDGQRLGSTSLEALRSGEPVGGGSGILPMVQAQRDRFKQKNQQLEEELSKTYATVTSLRQEVASLQKDNLSLYEKTRYVTAYSRGANASTSSAFAQAPAHTSVYSAQDSEASDRWRSQYEANITPFAAFRGKEATRAYRRMSLPERLLFSLTRMVLSTRTSRNLFASYCLALHLLVLLMLYWMSDSASGATYLAGGASAAMAGGGQGTAAKRPKLHPADVG